MVGCPGPAYATQRCGTARAAQPQLDLYLLEQILGPGKGPSALAEVRFAAADRHTVVIGRFEPRSVRPIRVVVDPTTLELWGKRGKK